MDNDKSFVLPCDNGSDSEMEVIDDDDGTSEQSMEIGNEDVLQETSTPMEKTDQRPSTNRQADEQCSGMATKGSTANSPRTSTKHGEPSTIAKSKIAQQASRRSSKSFTEAQVESLNILSKGKTLMDSPSLTSFEYRQDTEDEAYRFLLALRDAAYTDSLQYPIALQLMSSVQHGLSLRETHMSTLSDIKVEIKLLELGRSFSEEVKMTTIEKLLENQKHCLKVLIIHGGFKGTASKNSEKRLITFPEMKELKMIKLCVEYTIGSDIPGTYNQEIPDAPPQFPKFSIRFSANLPKLRCLVLGNSVDIQDLDFSTVRNLTEFRCASAWNFSITLTGLKGPKSLTESAVTEFQFPDGLKDPSFVDEVAKHFPNIKMARLNLPSASVLRAFFKAFEDLEVEVLHLVIQFDIRNTLEACLFPELNYNDASEQTSEEVCLFKTLKDYKYFDEYVKYFNVQLPTDQEVGQHSVGISALSKLKSLSLQHIGRQLLVPIPGEQKMWDDSHCMFMNKKLGFLEYVLNGQVSHEICKMNLTELVCAGVQMKLKKAD